MPDRQRHFPAPRFPAAISLCSRRARLHDLTPRDQPPVEWQRERERDDQADGHARPEERFAELGRHRTGHKQDERVVYNLHNRDRRRVRSGDNLQRAAERHARPPDRRERQ